MIIQIRGTSGSGKSTAMRQAMERIGDWNSFFKGGRKAPLYYRSVDCPVEVVTLGHYESPCGGCDTIGSARAVYELIQEVKAEVILCEGLLLSEDVKWSSQLPDLRVLFLTTPLERCLQQIHKRRKEKGANKPLNPTNTSNRVTTIERARVKLTAAGVNCRQCSARQAPEIISNWIKQCSAFTSSGRT